MPYSHDRTQSVECVTLNLPAISQHLADLRLPLLAFPKFFLQKGATWDSVFSILAWSFRCLLFGKWPRPETLSEPFLGFRFREKEDGWAGHWSSGLPGRAQRGLGNVQRYIEFAWMAGQGTHLPQMQLHPD